MTTAFFSENISLPREVPSSLKLKVVLFEPRFFFGLFFTLFGCVFVVVFGMMTDLSSFKFNGSEPVTKGVITGAHATGSSENNRQIYCYQYNYVAADGKTYDGKSYSLRFNANPGDTVNVEYLPGDPVTSRIRGMRRAPFSPWVLVVIIFPLSGIVILIAGMRKAVKNSSLLRNGMLVYGEVTRKEATNTKINNRVVYKVYFRFVVDGVTHESFVRTNSPERVLDEKQERILFNPDQPEEATLVDAMPQSVRKYFDAMESGMVVG